MRSREFHSSEEILYAKEISLRQQGEGKRPKKAQPITPEEESALWEKGQLGDFNGKVLTNVNFKKLDWTTGISWSPRTQEVPTKTRSGGLTIRRRTTPQTMFSTDGRKSDPVRPFKLRLSKRPEGMKNTGPLYLSIFIIINRPKSADVWYTNVRMG